MERELQRAQKNLESKAQQLLAQQADSAELTYLRQQLVRSQSALNATETDLADAKRELERLKVKDDELLPLQAEVKYFG